ncbi:MAG: class I SAM-dependent methyltransferase [Eubacteriales bacterium]|nr:class I SAM-dependent methyltransferase [Eubacteriales bacterium]
MSEKKQLEEMASFFDARVDGYEDHMRAFVDGSQTYYESTAQALPEMDSPRILDLGCGTGLELDEIYKRFPRARVTGVDLSAGMLKKLSEKHADKDLELLQMSYFDYAPPKEAFDAAVSVQSLHHFTHEEKLPLYRAVWEGLKKGGCYVETDYMAADQAQEDEGFARCRALRQEQGKETGFVHFDTPCTPENQAKALYKAGFRKVEKLWQEGNTVILKATKE